MSICIWLYLCTPSSIVLMPATQVIINLIKSECRGKLKTQLNFVTNADPKILGTQHNQQIQSQINRDINAAKRHQNNTKQ